MAADLADPTIGIAQPCSTASLSDSRSSSCLSTDATSLASDPTNSGRDATVAVVAAGCAAESTASSTDMDTLNIAHDSKQDGIQSGVSVRTEPTGALLVTSPMEGVVLGSGAAVQVDPTDSAHLSAPLISELPNHHPSGAVSTTVTPPLAAATIAKVAKSRPSSAYNSDDEVITVKRVVPKQAKTNANNGAASIKIKSAIPPAERRRRAVAAAKPDSTPAPASAAAPAAVVDARYDHPAFHLSRQPVSLVSADF